MKCLLDYISKSIQRRADCHGDFVFGRTKSFCLKLGVISALGLIICFVPVQAQPGEDGAIEGRVRGRLTGESLIGAQVTLAGTGWQTATDGDGNYRFDGVPSGAQRVTVDYVGLSVATKSVEVAPGGVVTLDFVLAPGGEAAGAEPDEQIVMLEKFMVIGDREESAQMRAMNQQRQMVNIMNVVAYDEFATPGDDNIGDYMRYIPGLSVMYSGRAAYEVQVRGLPGETSGITLDGMALSAADFEGSTRSAYLASVPTANIATIEVTKVPTPDRPAHGLGGAINISTKSGFERTRPLFLYNVHTTFDPALGVKERPTPGTFIDGHPMRASFSLSYILPIKKVFSFSVSMSEKNTYSETTTGVVNYNLVKGIPSSIVFAKGWQAVTVATARVGMDWKLGRRHVFGASYSYRNRRADQATPSITATINANATGDATYVEGSAAGKDNMSMAGTWASLSSITQHSDFKYKYLGSAWKINFGASYSVSEASYLPQEELGYFGGSMSITTGGMSRVNVTGIDSASRIPEEMVGSLEVFPRGSDTPFDFHDVSQYNLYTLRSVDRRTDVMRGQMRLDVQRNFIFGIRFSLRAGLSWSTQQQEVVNNTRVYTFRSGASTAKKKVGNYDVIADITPTFFGGAQTLIDMEKVYALKLAHPEYFTQTSANKAEDWRIRVNYSKLFEEDITAGYVRLDTRLFRNRLWLAAGVRYERTDDYGEGPLVDPTAQYQRNPDGTIATDAKGNPISITNDAYERDKLIYTERGSSKKTSYYDFFPSVNATYTLMSDLLLRAGYARTIGRPNLAYIIPGITYGAPNMKTHTQTITVVNTRLKPWLANNFDLSLESYMLKGGFGSISLFQKDISNFFLATSEEGTPERLAELGVFPDEGTDMFYSIVTRANGGDARIRGIEFSYRQKLLFLPNWARGFQVFVNYTRSKLSGPNTADFTGFNPETLSWGVNFIRKRFVVKFTATQQEEVKRKPVGTSTTIPAGVYYYQSATRRYTLSTEINITKQLSFYINWADFNSPDGYVDVLRRYNDDTPEALRGYRVVTWGQSIAVGIKGRF